MIDKTHFSRRSSEILLRSISQKHFSENFLNVGFTHLFPKDPPPPSARWGRQNDKKLRKHLVKQAFLAKEGFHWALTKTRSEAAAGHAPRRTPPKIDEFLEIGTSLLSFHKQNFAISQIGKLLGVYTFACISRTKFLNAQN